MPTHLFTATRCTLTVMFGREGEDLQTVTKDLLTKSCFFFTVRIDCMFLFCALVPCEFLSCALVLSLYPMQYRCFWFCKPTFFLKALKSASWHLPELFLTFSLFCKYFTQHWCIQYYNTRVVDRRGGVVIGLALYLLILGPVRSGWACCYKAIACLE